MTPQKLKWRNETTTKIVADSLPIKSLYTITEIDQWERSVWDVSIRTTDGSTHIIHTAKTFDEAKHIAQNDFTARLQEAAATSALHNEATTRITTTPKAICADDPRAHGIKKLSAHLGKSISKMRKDDTPLPVTTVLDANGLDDALWVVANVVKDRRIPTLFAADCAERVLHLFEDEYPNDNRPRRAIEAARSLCATPARAAEAAAWAAARAAARDAAWDAAWAAARDAATAAAWAAARDAAWAAARDAATAAAWAAEAAEAERAAEAAARDAAWAAARDAATAAALAAEATEAERAARDAERTAQTARLRQYLEHGEAAADMPWPEGEE